MGILIVPPSGRDLKIKCQTSLNARYSAVSPPEHESYIPSIPTQFAVFWMYHPLLYISMVSLYMSFLPPLLGQLLAVKTEKYHILVNIISLPPNPDWVSWFLFFINDLVCSNYCKCLLAHIQFRFWALWRCLFFIHRPTPRT